jgi:hypothetical protein
MKAFSLPLLAAIFLSADLASAESVNPPTTPQTAPTNAQEKKNLELVLNWWREVIEGGHLELTSRYQAEDYIQHNPNANTGRAGFIEFFSKFAKPKNPIPATLSNPPVDCLVEAGTGRCFPGACVEKYPACFWSWRCGGMKASPRLRRKVC